MFLVKFLLAMLPATSDDDFAKVVAVAEDATEIMFSKEFFVGWPLFKDTLFGDITLLRLCGDFGDDVEDFFMSNCCCCFLAAARLFTMADNEVLGPPVPFLIIGLC